MPKWFRASFGDEVAIVEDCFAYWTSVIPDARACTWSSYKHHNYVKLLIGITPKGVVSYISDALGKSDWT